MREFKDQTVGRQFKTCPRCYGAKFEKVGGGKLICTKCGKVVE